MSVWLWLLCAVTEGLDTIRFWATKRDWQHQKGDVDGAFLWGRWAESAYSSSNSRLTSSMHSSTLATEPAMAFFPQFARMRATLDADLSIAPLGSSEQDQTGLLQYMPRRVRYFVSEELATVPPPSSSQAVAELGI